MHGTPIPRPDSAKHVDKYEDDEEKKEKSWQVWWQVERYLKTEIESLNKRELTCAKLNSTWACFI